MKFFKAIKDIFYFYINKSSGEIHRYGCGVNVKEENRQYIGWCLTQKSAQQKAQNIKEKGKDEPKFPTANGCRYCCKEIDTDKNRKK